MVRFPIRFLGRVSCVLLLLMMVLLAGCDGNPGKPAAGNEVSGRVLTAGGRPASGASVYLATVPDYFPSATPMVVDSAACDRLGQYAFAGIESGNISVYAALWDPRGEELTAVSPLSQPFVYPDKSGVDNWNPVLVDVRREGSVSGRVTYFSDMEWFPAVDVDVTVERYRGAQFVTEGTAHSDQDGLYALSHVRTATYVAHGMKILDSDGPFPSYLVGETSPFFCDGRNPVQFPDLMLSDVGVRKPAIYIYPRTAGRFHVEVDLAPRARMTTSIPEYGDGWDVFIDTAGRIDDRWDYLFYELALRGAPLLREGWCLPAAEWETGLKRIVRQLGLNEAEARNFLEYWLQHLPRSPWLVVKPVMGPGLDHLASLQVRPAPDSVRRFWLLFSPADRRLDLPAPDVAPFVRGGTVLVEWGGLVAPRER